MLSSRVAASVRPLKDDEIEDSPLASRIVDISLTGAQLKTQHALCIGTKVELEIRDDRNDVDLRVEGEINWSKEDQEECLLGCQFDSRLDYLDLAKLYMS